MAETVNVGEIANRLSLDIFRHFKWNTHPRRDENFSCINENHKSSGDKPKISHPGDVVFSYDDPYLGSTIYLHTDLKSYGKSSIKPSSIRSAIKSLCMTVECAQYSEEWREIYSVDPSETYEVRGFLFLHNHDNGYEKDFYESIGKVRLDSLPIPINTYFHYLGPKDIQRLYSIGNDIIRLKDADELPKDYTFYYPDLVMSRRHGDVWNQAATIEVLTSPYMIIKHKGGDNSKPGYIVYYNRTGESVQEFEYLIDILLRFQMLDSDEHLRIRVTSEMCSDSIRSNFVSAKKKYSRAWGFDPVREKTLERIKIEEVTAVTSTYNPGNMGWRE
ncbi:hypothetical protein [Marinobacterium aestuarii]|uniref:hypothetical protein n=1 Tax=Marinobacterium aestuarii TaxID=1821621 RepID=UPI0009FEAA50|nr:hypothetical protein [Marinobacterium aestuarii]